MSERGPTLRMALIAPVFAYGWVMLLIHPLRWSVLSIAAVAALALPLVAIATPRFAGWIYAPAVGVFGATAITWAAHPGSPSSPFADLAMGVLIGAPVGIFGVIATHRASLPAVLLGLFGGLGVLGLDLAVVRALPSAPPAGATAWSSSSATVVGDQLGSLSQWAGGAGVAPPPLGFVGDPVFDALTLLAASGVMLLWLAFDARLSVRGVDGVRESPPPPGPAWTGVRSLVIAMGAVLAFEAAATSSPVLALSGALLAVAGSSVWIAWLVQPTAPPERPPPDRPEVAAAAVGADSAA